MTYLRVIVPGVLLVALLAWLPHAGGVFHAMFPELSHPLYMRTGFLALTGAHLALVAIASVVAVALGLGIGVAVTRPGAGNLLPTVRSIAVIGQTLPPVAVLALAVPAMGFGAAPTILALALYGILPVLGQTILGLQNIPAAARDAADGMGYRAWQRLRDVELPLAVGPIMAGIRLSVIVAIGTATIGSTVGATTLGSPIVEGLIGNNTAYVIQGVLLVGSLALFIDGALACLEGYLTPLSSRHGRNPVR